MTQEHKDFLQMQGMYILTPEEEIRYNQSMMRGMQRRIDKYQSLIDLVKKEQEEHHKMTELLIALQHTTVGYYFKNGRLFKIMPESSYYADCMIYSRKATVPELIAYANAELKPIQTEASSSLGGDQWHTMRQTDEAYGVQDPAIWQALYEIRKAIDPVNEGGIPC